jgi:hypothetical protein
MKLALIEPDVQPSFSKSLKDLPRPGHHLPLSVSVYQNVVKEGDAAVVGEAGKDVVHEGLKPRGAISHPKRHDIVLEEPVTGLKGRKMLIPRRDTDTIKGFRKIHLNEISGVTNLIQELIKQRSGVSVLYSDGV